MTRAVTRKSSDRIASLNRVRKKAGYDFLLLSDPTDIAYACGFISSSVVLLIGAKTRILFTDFRYQQSVEQFCRRSKEWGFVIVKRSVGEELAPYVPAGSHVGFQSDYMTVDTFSRMKKRLRRVRFSGCAEHIEPLFMVKRDDELAAMRNAARIGDRAFKMLLPHIVPGVTELDLVKRLESYCSELGSQKPSFDTIVLFGERSALPHGKPDPVRLKRGMFVLIDFGCTVEGFASDMTRTVVCGKASARQRELYRTVYAAQRRTREQARSGMTGSALDALARIPIMKAGYGDQFGHALGHGVGRRIHEAPRLSATVTARIPAGAVVTIEPGIYLPGFGGVRIEDMVVMRPEGATLLTHTSRELVEL
ncbi:MAG: aminopeptidase P family protein [Chitinispirillaceae bacterium]|nr:aminopeptidase P family protein [Chitinispirillaceae bacterium]